MSILDNLTADQRAALERELMRQPHVLHALLHGMDLRIVVERATNPPKPTLADPGPEVLAADVTAMMGTPDLLSAIAGRQRDPQDITHQALTDAWQALPEMKRYVIRRRFGLDGHPRATFADVAFAIGRHSATVSKLAHEMLQDLNEAIWPSPFRGLEPPVPRLLEAAGVTHPDQLASRINEVVKSDGFGRGYFRWLLAWLESHGYQDKIPGIMAALTKDNRDTLRLTS